MDNELEIQRVIENFYKIISGKIGEDRDWKSFKSLFIENAHLMSMKFNNNNECISSPRDVDSYIKGLNNFLQTSDFYEFGRSYKVEIFKDIAHVYNDYEAKISLQEKKPIKEGINFVQLAKVGGKWKIVSMLWQDK